MEYHELIIIGGGISGISMAGFAKLKMPELDYLVLEGRENYGGTWDLFKFPGIRSDSDMYTLGFEFHPWRDDDAIAGAPKIMKYLKSALDKYNLWPKFRFSQKVLKTTWQSDKKRWLIEVNTKDGTKFYESKFIYAATGYYSYENPYNPPIPGEKDFKGDLYHAQFWPEDYDYAGKRVAVIGSGATAVTLVPEMAKQAAMVTMIQRSPTYIYPRATVDFIGYWLKRIFPPKLAYFLTRKRLMWWDSKLHQWLLNNPEKARKRILKLVKDRIPKDYDMKHFTPKYDPWRERICAATDGDMFEMVSRGWVKIQTSHIEKIEENGVRLENGDFVEADVIIKATGLNVNPGPTFEVFMDDKKIILGNNYIYKGALISNLPNYAFVFGYTMASWTLKADLVAQYFLRLIKTMKEKNVEVAIPQIDTSTLKPLPMLDFDSGYIKRSIDILPKQSDHAPWKINQIYAIDKDVLLKQPIEDGVMKFF